MSLDAFEATEPRLTDFLAPLGASLAQPEGDGDALAEERLAMEKRGGGEVADDDADGQKLFSKDGDERSELDERWKGGGPRRGSGGGASSARDTKPPPPGGW